jgi:cytidine deaminase
LDLTTLRRLLTTTAPFALLSYGENVHKCQNWKWTVHAEEKAIENLPALPRKKHLKPVDMIVIRTSKIGCFGNSKPCAHCISKMTYRLPDKGYRLDKIYYTDGDGKMTIQKFTNLQNEPHHHVSTFYKSRMCAKDSNFIPPIEI